MNNFVKNTLNNADFGEFKNTDTGDGNEDSDSFKYSKFSPFRKENKRDNVSNNPYSYPKPPLSQRSPAYVSVPHPIRSNSFKFKEREMRNKRKRNVCNNCGIQGHLNIDCKQPIYSYGLIILDSTESNVLLVQRKDSFGYISLINNERLPTSAINLTAKNITYQEHQKITCFDFESLWRDVINNPRLLTNRKALEQNKERFKMFQIKDIVGHIDSKSLPTETEWGFPKGRIKKREKWIDCARREASEETNILEENIEIMSDMPFMENIKGFDDKMYINIYYVARVKDDSEVILIPQKQEIKKLRWVEINSVEDFFDTASAVTSSKKKLMHQLKRYLNILRTNGE